MSAGNDYTHVEFAAMEQGEADFMRTYSSLAQVLDDLQNQLQTNLADWDGSAQQAFYEAHMVWNAAMANLQSVLSQLGSAIGAANANYQEAERTILSRWS